MKHHVRTLTCGAAQLAGLTAALIAALTGAGCGGRQTMASKSAAAFDEAKREGSPIAAGEHGGHAAEAAPERPPSPSASQDHAPMAGMDHSTMAGMDHGAMPEMNHAQAPKTTAGHAQMNGMHHATMPGMQHGSAAGSSPAGAHDMAGLDTSATAATNHSRASHANIPGMQHGAAARAHDIAAMD